MGEFEFIQRIRDRAGGRRSSDLVLGIGDDAAILSEREGRETVVSVDLLVEGVDFKLEYAVPRWLGHKALAVSLSDIAAMGGAPAFALLTLGIPPSLAQDGNAFWEEFFDGFFALAEMCGVTLVGGDISSTSGPLTIDSVVVGHCRAGKAVRRSGAQAGDGVYVTGTLGGSAAGLHLLLNGARPDPEDSTLVQSAIQAHLQPTPPVRFGREVGAAGLATAMIDVSDGLSQDLAHICEESRVDAVLDYETIPIAEETAPATADAEEAFLLAIGGGEDFQLLLTGARENEAGLFQLAKQCNVRLSRIGEIVASQELSPAVRLRRDGELRPLLTSGYDHFAAPSTV
jgi:thiamine-monophosphate kinase